MDFKTLFRVFLAKHFPIAMGPLDHTLPQNGDFGLKGFFRMVDIKYILDIHRFFDHLLPGSSLHASLGPSSPEQGRILA